MSVRSLVLLLCSSQDMLKPIQMYSVCIVVDFLLTQPSEPAYIHVEGSMILASGFALAWCRLSYGPFPLDL